MACGLGDPAGGMSGKPVTGYRLQVRKLQVKGTKVTKRLVTGLKVTSYRFLFLRVLVRAAMPFVNVSAASLISLAWDVCM